MRVLIVGGAGYVGTLVRPALMAEHDCHCFDLLRVEALGDRSIVGDVNDQKAVRQAVRGVDAIIYLPMGGVGVDSDDYLEERAVSCAVGGAFDVNVQGFYRFLWEGLAAGTRRFVYASSLSVYNRIYARGVLDETTAPDAWGTYSVTKQLGEQLCHLAARQCPEATIIALRLIKPLTEEQVKEKRQGMGKAARFCLAPKDTGRLFLAALACPHPGAHIVQTTGDQDREIFPNAAATQLLGWRPMGT
jgi:uronate dehydrogenase